MYQKREFESRRWGTQYCKLKNLILTLLGVIFINFIYHDNVKLTIFIRLTRTYRHDIHMNGITDEFNILIGFLQIVVDTKLYLVY